MKITIYTHSIVDVITNSSSEMFTIDTDRTKEFLVELFNNFCKENGINYKFSTYSFDDTEEDWEVKNAIEILTEKGYVITRKDPTKKGYSFCIDRDFLHSEGEELKNFIILEFDPIIEYDK